MTPGGNVFVTAMRVTDELDLPARAHARSMRSRTSESRSRTLTGLIAPAPPSNRPRLLALSRPAAWFDTYPPAPSPSARHESWIAAGWRPGQSHIGLQSWPHPFHRALHW